MRLKEISHYHTLLLEMHSDKHSEREFGNIEIKYMHICSLTEQFLLLGIHAKDVLAKTRKSCMWRKDYLE